MATVPRLVKPQGLTPDGIMHTLFSFRDRAHKFHLNTMVIGVGSHAQHIALDGLYKGIQDQQDTILEQLMGYLAAPINGAGSVSIEPYAGTSDAIALCDEIKTFAKELQNYGTQNDMPNIENLAQELSGLAAHTRYFLMFK